MHLDVSGSKVLVCGEGEPWFCGKPLASALGHKNPQQALRVHVDQESRLTLGDLMARPAKGTDGGVLFSSTPLSHNQKTAVWVDEPGLYDLVGGSKKPEALG